MVDGRVVYVIVNNIPKSYHSSDLRNFFSQFLESSGFSCFHFRHRPEVQKACPDLSKTNDSSSVVTSSKSRCITTCCVVKVYENRFKELMQLYHRKHWVDRNGSTMMTRCFIKKIKILKKCGSGKEQNSLESVSSDQEATFTEADLTSMIEMQPPVLMPNGNVGTPTKYFLEQIRACRLPPSIISKLRLEFPGSKPKRLYGTVNYDYGGRVKKSCSSNEDMMFAKTLRGDIIADVIIPETVSEEKESHVIETPEVEADEESEEEEWDRHESLHNDVTQQERIKERLFEEEIELKWEKGGSGLVFYTDAQFWDAKEGDFDAKTADDWDIDMSGYYEHGAGDKDARDYLKIRLEQRLRQGTYIEKTDLNDFAGFEKYTKGFGRRCLEAQGWKEGQGVGKNVTGIVEPIMDIGQHPKDKKGFGYRGEKLNLQPVRKSKRRRRSYDDDDNFIRISTIYDNPAETDPPEPLLRSSYMTQLTYRKKFLKETSCD